ncbi:hypothetical protein HJC23_014086 [Cyclotella cryptica]|uniref:K Homology domain-containing protein n=1 Tax=Cyclotella cryptica TaxID=29204 RepID=A0ABD3QSX8_9STRA|eukprot:CCRYP_002494-RA/>CCRYP_002494-RA protein AED:0.00 eAED:0.00 QI:170/-1/1/1/-1/1/1/155/636
MPAQPNYSSYHHSKYPPPTTNNSSINNTNNNPTGRTSPQHANINIHPPSTTPESLALSHLRLPSISHPQQQCQASIYVPSYTVGAVIGRGGRTILNVQREAMRRSLGHAGSVRISVLGGNAVGSGGGGGEDNGGEFVPPSSTATTTATTTTSHKNPSSPWNYHEYYHSVQTNAVTAFEGDDNHDAPERRNDDDNDDDNDDHYYTPIIIRGDPVGCFAALRQLLPLVDHAHDPHIIFEVPIHRSKHGLLLGVRGLVLASLSAMFHVRIRIPPNGTGGGENHGYWQPPQQQQQQPLQQLHAVYGSNAGGNDIGSTMLFPEANVVHHNTISNDVVVPASSSTPLSSSSHSPPSTTTPPNVIQLEGEIDNVEQCLVKMLSIVAGEPYFPTGVIVHCGTVDKDGTNEYNITNNNNNNSNTVADYSRTGSSHSKESTTTTTTTHPGESNMKAVAVLTATQHNNNNNISQNKFRSIQRKTNTLIRRKKGRFRFNGVEYGGRTEGSDPAAVDEGEGESAALVMNDNDDVEEEEEEEEEREEDADDDALATAGGKIIPISFVVSGKVENVKAAVQQLEKLLGLEPYSTVISLREVPFKGNGGGEENSPTSKSNDGGSGGGGASVENEKKKRNQRNKAKRKPMKNQ